MIKLTDILSERHKKTPHERVQSYMDRIQKVKDKIAKKEGSKEQIDLWKGQIQALAHVLSNYKQQVAIKKQAQQSKKNA